MAANVSQLVAEYGDYYEAGGQNEKDLLTLFKQPIETEALFPLGLATVGPGQSTKVRKASVETSRVLQGFQKAWTPLGGTTFTPREIDLFRVKIDAEETPDDLVNTWAGFLTSNSLKREEWPFAKWIAQVYLTEQHKEDRELLEIFQGEFAVPTTGTAGPAGTAMDGVRKQIRNNYATGDSGVQVLGAVPTDEVDFCEYVEQFVSGIPELVRGRVTNGRIAMSQTLRDRYKEGKRKKYNLQYSQATNLTNVMHKENFEVVGLASHAGSPLIWFSPDFNKNRYLIAENNQNIFTVESAKRKVALFTDYWIGLGFWIPNYLYHNDQDL